MASTLVTGSRRTRHDDGFDDGCELSRAKRVQGDYSMSQSPAAEVIVIPDDSPCHLANDYPPEEMRTPGPVYRKSAGPSFPLHMPQSGGLFVTFDELVEGLNRLLLVENKQVFRSKVGPRPGFGPVHITVASWLTDLRRAFKLSHVAVCLAMAYFDRVTWTMNIQVPELEAVIAACVLIACTPSRPTSLFICSLSLSVVKFNDPDPDTPSRLTLNLLSECCEGNVNPAAIMQQEVAVLSRGLQWELNLLTHMSFLDVLLALQTDNQEGDATWQKRISTVAHDLALRVMTGTPSLFSSSTYSG